MTEGTSRCSHCGAVMASGVRFCPECGRPSDGRAPNTLAWILGVAAGIILILLLFFLLGNRRKTPPITESVPIAPSGPPINSAPPRMPTGAPLAVAPGRPAAPPDPMRAAVAAYLQQMAEVEARRKQIVNNLYPAMLTLALLKNMGGMQDMLAQLDENVDEDQKKAAKPQGAQQAQGTIDGYRNQFRALASSVQRIRPPVPAQSFQNGYITSLARYDDVIGQIAAAMNAGDQSIAGKGGALSGQVSQTLSATDAELQRLLDRYHLTRTFTVSDAMAGSLTGTQTLP